MLRKSAAFCERGGVPPLAVGGGFVTIYVIYFMCGAEHPLRAAAEPRFLQRGRSRAVHRIAKVRGAEVKPAGAGCPHPSRCGAAPHHATFPKGKAYALPRRAQNLQKCKPQTFLSISFLPPRGKKTAPSSEGAKECARFRFVRRIFPSGAVKPFAFTAF